MVQILCYLGKKCEIGKNISDPPEKRIFYKWLLAIKISLNCDKTEIIFFHKPGEKVPDFEMNGHRIFPSKKH